MVSSVCRKFDKFRTRSHILNLEDNKSAKTVLNIVFVLDTVNLYKISLEKSKTRFTFTSQI